MDPVDQVSVSNYATFANNPIFYIDEKREHPAIYFIYAGGELLITGLVAWLVAKKTTDFIIYLMNNPPKYLELYTGDAFKNDASLGNPGHSDPGFIRAQEARKS